jgi:hypothetical protein
VHAVDATLNGMNGQVCTLAVFFLGKEPLVLIEYEAGWAPGPVWTLEKR